MERLYWLGFSLFPGVGSALFTKLLTHFRSAEAAWKSSESEFKEIVGEKLADKFFAFKKTIDLAQEAEKLVQKHISLVTLEDKEYPELLRQIGRDVTSDFDESFSIDSRLHGNDKTISAERKAKVRPPFLLYVKGNVDVLSSCQIIGVVGTRKITPYGRQVTELLTAELVQQGYTVVSGLAFGVDATAHLATLKNTGKTIAVLGCGVDCCTPSSHQKIYDEILNSGGAIVSTFPPGMQPTIGSFPARNALIAGLSQGILVTEGAADSGSLITATYAQKMGRPIFAVPGPITSRLSKGANNLLKDGAVAVTDARDIIAALSASSDVGKFTKNIPDSSRIKRVIKGASEEENQVLELLENGPLHFDEIVRTIGKDSKTVGSLLSLMELKGLVESISDGKYSLNF